MNHEQILLVIHKLFQEVIRFLLRPVINPVVPYPHAQPEMQLIRYTPS